jgi:peptidoglycan/LPS O-acetylase OafA/YrhL
MGVIFHCSECLHATGLGIPQIPAAAASVGLFFTISGFVMVHISSERHTTASFALGRLAGIVWPATFAAIALIALRPWLLAGLPLTP